MLGIVLRHMPTVEARTKEMLNRDKYLTWQDINFEIISLFWFKKVFSTYLANHDLCGFSNVSQRILWYSASLPWQDGWGNYIFRNAQMKEPFQNPRQSRFPPQTRTSLSPTPQIPASPWTSPRSRTPSRSRQSKLQSDNLQWKWSDATFCYLRIL